MTSLKGDKKEFIPSPATQDPTRDHWVDFLKCVRTRGRPLADVEFGYKVQAALCAGVLAWKDRKVARYDVEKKDLVLV